MPTRPLLLALIAMLGCRSEPPAVTAVSVEVPPMENPLARGEYVATISGCVSCHTPLRGGAADPERALAGGREEVLAGGGWRSPNITPDRETGIGAWTDAQIIAAIRTGVRPDGERLQSIMPSAYYRQMTDADVWAVVAFLRAQRPIANAVERSRLELPPVEPQEERAKGLDEESAHGAYLVSLMHCGACHTPREGLHAGAPFAGGVRIALGGGRTMTSANLTSDPETGLGRWTADQIIQAIRTMRKPGGAAIEGPMATRYAEAWSELGARDAQALAAYLRSIPPVRNEIPPRHHASLTGAR